jgi:hypothetical protein
MIEMNFLTYEVFGQSSLSRDTDNIDDKVDLSLFAYAKSCASIGPQLCKIWIISAGKVRGDQTTLNTVEFKIRIPRRLAISSSLQTYCVRLPGQIRSEVWLALDKTLALRKAKSALAIAALLRCLSLS